MLAAALIVFREALEAALMIGIIAAATRAIAARGRWISFGVAAGVLGSLVVAGLAGWIAALASGNGQEIFTAAVLATAVAMLAWHNVWMARHGAEMAARARGLGASVVKGEAALSAIALAIALTVLREGSETVLFLQGVAASGNGGALSVLGGGALGLGGGALLGAVIYLGLLRVPLRWFFKVIGWLVLLLAAGMASQLARVLTQADLLPTIADKAWDTSALLPVDSLLGVLLHSLIGYDATPSGVQVAFYCAALVAIFVSMRAVAPRPSQPIAT